MKNLKDIHLGNFIRERVRELDMDTVRICNFFNCDLKELDEMYEKESMDSHLLLKWSKLVEYDFFRLFSQHLTFYAPQKSSGYLNIDRGKSIVLPQFKKNIYTREMIDFIIELVETKRKAKNEIIKEYRIPKTTLYQWLAKYKTSE